MQNNWEYSNFNTFSSNDETVTKRRNKKMYKKCTKNVQKNAIKKWLLNSKLIIRKWN